VRIRQHAPRIGLGVAAHRGRQRSGPEPNMAGHAARGDSLCLTAHHSVRSRVLACAVGRAARGM
jgi:hypothetical protein